MKLSLVVMAAGMASRYGGNKQITGMGPNGEILMEYSIHDAIRAGFERVVFIIRPDMLDMVKRQCGDRFARQVEACYAFQDYSSLPDWYRLPEGRTKPFGTVHAVLCAREYIDGPFAVINADDYYGVEPYQIMHDFLADPANAGGAAMMGYRLKNTVSKNGDVTRGVCAVTDGLLTTVDEVHKIHLYGDGRIADLSAGEPGRPLDPEALVSMNFWGFPAGMMDALAADFDAFLRAADPADLKSECLLPVVVDRRIREGAIRVSVLKTDAVWFGVTYQEDRPLVQQSLRQLHDSGVYGGTL